MSSIRYAKKSRAPLFGAWLRGLREEKGVMLREAAAAAEMDLTHLSKAELGQRLITKEQMVALARYFRVDDVEAEGRRLAEKFRHDAKDDPKAGEHAVLFLAEQAGIYKGKKAV